MTSGYHERHEDLSESTRDLHRALSSLMEELEAVDWYQQRVDATDDGDLAQVLAHNRDEEIEHACMVIEWLRRNHVKFDEQLRRFLFTSGPIIDPPGRDRGAASGSLGLGKLTQHAGAPRRRILEDEDHDDESSA